MNRFRSLDGWRGLSILFVLAGHLLPLGPKSWQMNTPVAGAGMALFFILSGFLITNILMRDNNIFRFLVRRFMRIVPLAWFVMGVTLILIAANQSTFLAHFLFYANWPPMFLTRATSHLWSLCVEIQFYVLIAFLVASFKSRAFILLPLLSIAVTLYRYINGVEMAINTYYRVDEILAGCILALLYKDNAYSISITRFFRALNPVYIFPLLLLSAHPEAAWVNYFRPYIAMLLIGSTLFSENKQWCNRMLDSKFLFYIASISFALYVFHGGLRETWLGEGDILEKYIKRPLFFVVIFILAHVSTFYYEKYWIRLGKKITTKK
ncbi:MAG: acyltransferase family protein [Thiohalomonadales bacterium]